MNLHQAAAFTCPHGRHRLRPLACVALDDPAYLLAIADGKHDGECRPGTAFRDAVEVVAARIRRNLEDDILSGHTIDPGALSLATAEAADHNGTVRSRQLAVEERKGRDRGLKAKVGAVKASAGTGAAATPMTLFDATTKE